MELKACICSLNYSMYFFKNYACLLLKYYYRSFSLIFAEIGLIKELLIVIQKPSKRLFLKIVLFFKSFRFFLVMLFLG